MTSTFAFPRLFAAALLIALLCPRIGWSQAGSPCALQVESATTAEALFNQFDASYSYLDLQLGQYGKLKPGLIKSFSLERLLHGLHDSKADLDTIFGEWKDSEPQTLSALSAKLASVNRKMGRAAKELGLWLQRQSATTFQEARQNRFLLMPNQMYDVQTDRGEKIRVRFSRSLVEEFFWSEADTTMQAAAEHALDAVGRGFDATRGAPGIGYLPERDGVKVMKLHFRGRSFGAYRVYGIFDNGAINFVTWEHSSDHDCQYLGRVCARAVDTFKHETWK